MTVGALSESLAKGTLRMDLFHTVVIDECHNMAKNKHYQLILGKVCNFAGSIFQLGFDEVTISAREE